jgi:hypothetical protein
MLTPADEKFLKVAVAAAPRVAEIITSYPAAYRQGALEVAENRYMQAARDFGCTEQAAGRCATLLMRDLRKRLRIIRSENLVADVADVEDHLVEYNWPFASPSAVAAMLQRLIKWRTLKVKTALQ